MQGPAVVSAALRRVGGGRGGAGADPQVPALAGRRVPAGRALAPAVRARHRRPVRGQLPPRRARRAARAARTGAPPAPGAPGAGAGSSLTTRHYEVQGYGNFIISIVEND